MNLSFNWGLYILPDSSLSQVLSLIFRVKQLPSFCFLLNFIFNFSVIFSFFFLILYIFQSSNKYNEVSVIWDLMF